jgi:hypothetical protein
MKKLIKKLMEIITVLVTFMVMIVLRNSVKVKR